MAKDDSSTLVPPVGGTSGQFAALLRGSFGPTLAVGAVASMACLLIGPRTAWSVAVGCLLVLTFFSISLLVMRQTAHLQPIVVMSVVLATYTGKLIALTVALFALQGVQWLSGRALGLSTIACTVVWLACEMRAFTRLRVLVAGSPAGGSTP
jgi:ATP synthase protein I